MDQINWFDLKKKSMSDFSVLKISHNVLLRKFSTGNVDVYRFLTNNIVIIENGGNFKKSFKRNFAEP